MNNLSQSETVEFVKYMLYALFMFLNIDSKVVEILAWLMVLDTVFGIVKTISLGQRFTFNRLIMGFVSKLSVLLLPMTVALIGIGLSFNFKWFVDVTLDLLIVSEGISIFTHFVSIKQMEEIKNDDLVSKIINAVRNAFLKLFKKLLGSLEDEPQQHQNNDSHGNKDN
jgi:hypothetical protein